MQYFYVAFETILDNRRGNRLVIQSFRDGPELDVTRTCRDIMMELGSPVILTFWCEISPVQHAGLLSYVRDCEAWLARKLGKKPTTILKLIRKEPDETDPHPTQRKARQRKDDPSKQAP